MRGSYFAGGADRDSELANSFNLSFELGGSLEERNLNPSAFRRPNLQCCMFCNMAEILIGCQHCQVIAQAELRQQRVDRPDLHTFAAALIAQFRRMNVVVAIRHDQRQGGKPLDDLVPALGAGETLQNFLEHEAGGEKRLTGFERPDQHCDFGASNRAVLA